jgi:hypothetical protein
MYMNARKTLKVGTGLALVGFGAYRLAQKETHWNSRDPLAWLLIGLGTSHLLQEAVRVTEDVWEEKREAKQKEKNRYYPIL